MDFELSCVCHSCCKQSTIYLILQPVVLGNNGCCLCFDKFLPIWKLMFILFFPFLGLANPIQQIFLNRPYLPLSSVHQVICFPPKGRAKKWIITPDLRGGLTNTSEIANPMNIFQNNVCFFFFWNSITLLTHLVCSPPQLPIHPLHYCCQPVIPHFMFCIWFLLHLLLNLLNYVLLISDHIFN